MSDFSILDFTESVAKQVVFRVGGSKTSSTDMDSEYCFYFKYIKICNVTKLLAYEIQTPLNEQTWLTSFSVTSVSNTRVFCFFFSLAIAAASPITLFTDHLKIRVLNKNEVRKWLKITDHAEHAKQQQNMLWRRK